MKRLEVGHTQVKVAMHAVYVASLAVGSCFVALSDQDRPDSGKMHLVRLKSG